MIPQADLDRALARWKARMSGQDTSAPAPAAAAHPGDHRTPPVAIDDPTRVAGPGYEVEAELSASVMVDEDDR